MTFERRPAVLDGGSDQRNREILIAPKFPGALLVVRTGWEGGCDGQLVPSTLLSEVRSPSSRRQCARDLRYGENRIGG